MTLILVLLHSLNFFQDSTYPGIGVSGRTAGNMQLDDSLSCKSRRGKGDKKQ